MRTLLLYCFLAVALSTRAQTPVQEFGVLSEVEKKLTVCDFDKEAEAVILFDQASSNHNDDRNLITNRHIRIKVLRQKGIQRGNIEIYYYAKDEVENISNIRAAVHNLDDLGNQQTKELSASSIFRQKLSDKISSVKFALPDVKVGSIIEYEYTSTLVHYGWLQDWYFQTDIPTILSSYSLVILPNAEFAYQVHKSDELPVTIKQNKAAGNILFEMSNVAGLRDEPYMDAPKDYRQHVEFQLSAYGSRFGGRTRYMTTWDELTRELMGHEDFGTQLNRNVSDAAPLVNNAKSRSTEYERMITVYKEVQRAIDWNGYNSKFAPDGIKSVWDKKKGTNGEINLLLINLLKETGLEVYPLLVSERFNGKVRTDYPFLDQFNTVMAYVVADARNYVLDASGSYTPPELIPFSVVNTKAFIVNKKKGGIISLNDNNKMKKNRVTIKAEMNTDGELVGDARITSYDYSRITRLRYFKESKEKLLDVIAYKEVPGIRADSFQVNNTDNDSLPLVQSFRFGLPANLSGDYHLLNLNLFTGFRENPFISDVRFTNVDFGCRQFHEIAEQITLPPQYRPESIPKDLRLIMPDTSISLVRYVTYENNTITTLFRIQMNKSVYTAEEYPLLKEFYKKMINILNEPFVLRKNN